MGVRGLGDLERAIMEVVWSTDHPVTGREVVDELGRARPFAYTTVLTLVSRLWSRGLLAREPEGRGFRYRAAKSRDEFLAELSDELIDRLFADFGAIGVARLGERLNEFDAQQRQRPTRGKKDK